MNTLLKIPTAPSVHYQNLLTLQNNLEKIPSRSSNLKNNRPTSDLISHLLRSFLFPRTNYNSLKSNVLKYYAQCLLRCRHHQDSLHFFPTEIPVCYMLFMSSSLTSVKTTRSKCLYHLLDTILKLGQTKQNSVTYQTLKIQTQMKTGFFLQVASILFTRLV